MKAKGYRVLIVGSEGRQIADLLQHGARVAVAEGKVRKVTATELFHLHAQPCIPELFPAREPMTERYCSLTQRLRRKKGRTSRW